MRWYGLKSLVTQKHALQLFKKKKNFNSKKYLKGHSATINTNPYKMLIFVPGDWTFLLLMLCKNTNFISDKHVLCFFSSTYFFFCPLNLQFCNWTFTKSPNVFSAYFIYKSIYTKTFWTRLYLIFYSFTKIFFKKLKFKGKGYYIYKNKRNTIALQFNYSHIRRLYLYFTYIKFLSKTSILVFGYTPFTLKLAANALLRMRPLNIFTGKGVRFTRQIIYRKTGKVSSYR